MRSDPVPAEATACGKSGAGVGVPAAGSRQHVGAASKPAPAAGTLLWEGTGGWEGYSRPSTVELFYVKLKIKKNKKKYDKYNNNC